jgi:hypothetical protein
METLNQTGDDRKSARQKMYAPVLARLGAFSSNGPHSHKPKQNLTDEALSTIVDKLTGGDQGPS